MLQVPKKRRAARHRAFAWRTDDKNSCCGGWIGKSRSFAFDGGEAADITQAQTLIDGFDAVAIVVDKGYDSDAFVISIMARNAEAVIPSRKNRIIGREYDRHVYKDRNLVERFFNRIKQFRRLATRYEKLARRFMAMLHLVFAFIWLQ